MLNSLFCSRAHAPASTFCSRAYAPASTSPRFVAWALLAAEMAALPGCLYEFKDSTPRQHNTVGAETFRLVCMNLAAQAFPNDLTGERFAPRCDGSSEPSVDAGASTHEADPPRQGEEAERNYQRYLAIVSKRTELVKALDFAFESAAYEPDELRDFLGEMVPLYDPPELLPQLTRSAATLLGKLIDPNDPVGAEASRAFERMSPRDGYRPARFGLGLTRAMLGYPKLDELLRTTLAAIAPDGPARPEYEDLLRAAALDLATAESGTPDLDNPGTLTVSKQLLFAEDDTFAGQGTPAYLTRRDARGMAQPLAPDGVMAAPFQDKDGDGRADIDAQGRFVVAGDAAPAPYLTFAAASNPTMTPRDAFGRATNKSKQPIYASVDVDRTLLAGVLREVAPLLEAKGQTKAALLDALYGLNALLGNYGERTQTFGKAKLSFQGPDTGKSPLLDLVYALTSLLPNDQTLPLLEVLEALLRDHENELAGLAEAMLYIKERGDAYPDAKWEKPHEFWDDLIAWAVGVGNVPGLMESLLRTFTTDEMNRFGPLVGNFMRFKDRVNYPLGKLEELDALGINPLKVSGKLAENPCTGPNKADGCGKPCDLTHHCDPGLACVVEEKIGSPKGTCKSVSDAVAAHRINVNSPCLPMPTDTVNMMFTSIIGPDWPNKPVEDKDANCEPQVDPPAADHKGFRGCPEAKPEDGASCAAAGGFGLCSWAQGSCTCDCAGGLCRHGAEPTWRCTDKRVAGYSQFVDRTQPDNLKGADGQPNQSLFQRTLALVHDLAKPAKFCSKADANIVLYDPAGSNRDLYTALGGANLAPVLKDVVDGLGLLGPFTECDVIKEDNIIRFYLRANLGYGGLEIQNDELNKLMNQTIPVDLKIDPVKLVDRQTQIRGFNLANPTPRGIGRWVFSPNNLFLDNVFPLGTTRDGLTIVDLRQDTIMAWEVKDPVSEINYLKALIPILKALDPKGKAEEGYISLYADVFSIIHKHWSSPVADSTERKCDMSMPPTCDEAFPRFAYKSNGVSYEELVAEATLDAQIVSRIHDLMVALDGITVADGRDGITVLTDVVLNMLIPERACVAGDCTTNPIAYRDGHTTTATNTGKPIDEVSLIYLLLDSLNAIDARFEQGSAAERLAPWRSARSRLVDVFFDVDRDAPGQWHFKNRRGRAVLQQVIPFVRERLTKYRGQQAECMMAGGAIQDCPQLRDWALGLAPRLAASLGQPVSAATFRLLDRLRAIDTDPAGKLADFMKYLASESADDDTFSASLLATADTLQILEDTRNIGPVMAFASRAIAENTTDAVSSGTDSPDVQNGTLEKALALTRALQNLSPETADKKSTIAHLLERLTKPYDDSGASPLDTILDAVVAVNRGAPGAHDDIALQVEDLRALLGETKEFLDSKRHGLERLYDVVRSRELP